MELEIFKRRLNTWISTQNDNNPEKKGAYFVCTKNNELVHALFIHPKNYRRKGWYILTCDNCNEIYKPVEVIAWEVESYKLYEG